MNRNTDETAVRFRTTWGHTKGCWENIGGGCFLDGFKFDYPCDDQYENSNTMRRVTVYSTEERHFDMPEFVDDPSELYRLDGVKPEWVQDSETWKQ